MDVSALVVNEAQVAERAPGVFRPIVGEIRSAWSDVKPKFGEHGFKTAARKNGLSFEKKAKEKLSSVFSNYEHHAGQWLAFDDVRGRRYCQPDFYAICSTFVALFEIKIRHCEIAWWQLHRLYAPVLEKIYWRPVARIEMVKSYDPATYWPEGDEKQVVVFDFDAMMERLPPVSRDKRTLIVQWSGK